MLVEVVVHGAVVQGLENVGEAQSCQCRALILHELVLEGLGDTGRYWRGRGTHLN